MVRVNVGSDIRELSGERLPKPLQNLGSCMMSEVTLRLG